MTAPIPPSKVLDPSHKEALVSLTALLLIEEHHLLPKDKLADAKSSLQALFLRTTGEETLLRKLIEILKITQGIQRSFAQIANILDGIRASAVSVENKLTALRVVLEMLHVSAEENAAFVGPFLSFSQILDDKIGAFARTLEAYLDAKEEEARLTNIHRIARAARARLKQRLAGGLGAETHGEVETRIKREVVSSFDYTEAEVNLKYAQRESRNKEEEVRAQLADIKAMCQQAMNPTMRDQDENATNAAAAYDDVFALFLQTLRSHPRLLQIKDYVLELFKMYQHAFGMFNLDFQNLNRSIATMIENPEAYFESKEEDRDIRAKREKLRRIEGLIPFLERTAESFTDEENDTHSKFSRHMSDMISENKAPWEHICGDLLRAKVQAEADLSTRL
jgi:hypothetical protein